MIAQVNYLGVVELLDAWQPALARADKAKVVAFSSNSTTTPLVPRRTVKVLLDGKPDKAVGSVVFVDGGSDAYFRSDAWPHPGRLRELAGYLRKMRAFAARNPRTSA